MKNTERYKKIKRTSLKSNISDVETHIPTPTKDDYGMGFVKRYFIQLVNDKNSIIYEVNDRVYLNHEHKSFYARTSLKWRISGNLDESYDMNGNLINKSVKESN